MVRCAAGPTHFVHEQMNERINDGMAFFFFLAAVFVMRVNRLHPVSSWGGSRVVLVDGGHVDVRNTVFTITLS